jgi:hypothetical protein
MGVKSEGFLREIARPRSADGFKEMSCNGSHLVEQLLPACYFPGTTEE